MARYAIKIGKIHIQSDEPISEQQRKEVVAHLRKGHVQELLMDSIIKIIVPGPHHEA